MEDDRAQLQAQVIPILMMARYIKIFAIIDVVFLAIQAITIVFRLVAVPFPIAGYLAGRVYNTKFAYIYAFYQALNIFTEAGLMMKVQCITSTTIHSLYAHYAL
jgi:hypothetical protein